MDAVLEALAGEISQHEADLEAWKQQRDEELAGRESALDQLRALEATAKEIRVSRNGDEGGGPAVPETPVKPRRQNPTQGSSPRSAASRSGNGAAPQPRVRSAFPRLILEELQKGPEQGMAGVDLGLRTGASKKAFARAMDKLRQNDQVEKIGNRGAGVRYRLKSAAPADDVAAPADDGLSPVERSILDTVNGFGRGRDDLYSEIEGSEQDIDVALASLTTRRRLRKVTRHGATVYVAVATP